MVKDIGSVSLRGLDEDIQLYQILPKKLKSRYFPKFHLEEIISDENEKNNDIVKRKTSFYINIYNENHTINDITLNWKDDLSQNEIKNNIKLLYHFMSTLLSIFSEKDRINILQNHSQKWRANEPMNISGNIYAYNELMLQLIMKVAKAMDVNNKFEKEENQ